MLTTREAASTMTASDRSHAPSPEAWIEEITVKPGERFPLAWEERVVEARINPQAKQRSYTLLVVRRDV